MGKVVQDRAQASTIADVGVGGSRLDSGFCSGGSLPSPLHKSVPDFNRSDSGICEKIDSLVISQTSPGMINNQQQQGPPSPHHNIMTYYAPDDDGDTSLHMAIIQEDTEVFYKLVHRAPFPTLLDIQNSKLYAPLHIAVLLNQPLMVRRLVVAGASTDISDNEGNTALHLAAKLGLRECAHALLSPISTDELRAASVDAGSDQTSRLHAVLDVKNYNGECCVHLATFGKHYNLLMYLNHQQANMDATEGRSGNTVLHYAVNMGDERMVRMLATPKEQGGCGVNLNTRNWYGRTALQNAYINRSENIFRYLKSIPGCDVALDESDEDYEFDTDEDVDYDKDYADIEINGVRTVESRA